MSCTLNDDFVRINKTQIESALHEVIDKALHEKYGKQPDERIVQRVSEEWAAMERTDTVLDIAALYELTNMIRKKEVPYMIRGLSGSGFVLYLLGITGGNPLPPHSYCPCCKSVRFEKNYHDGFDIPQGRVCRNDNILTIGDGHNIPWQTLWGYGEFCPTFEIILPAELYNDMKEIAQNHWLKSHPYKYESVFSWGLHDGVYTIMLHNIRLKFSLYAKAMVPSFDNILVSANEREIILENWKECAKLSEDEKFAASFDLFAPKNVADVISVFGLYCSEGVRDFAADVIKQTKEYSLSDMIAFRDDVFFYLVKHGFLEKDSWHWMNMVRKGLDLPVITKQMENAADSILIEFCSKARWLCCKADIVEQMLFWLKEYKLSLSSKRNS